MSDEQSESKNGWLKKLSALLSDHSQPNNPRQHFLALLQEYRSAYPQFSDDTATMMEALLDLNSTQVRDIMIPRGQMVLIQENWSLEKVFAVIIESGHSRYPVVNEEFNQVLGILISKDLLPMLLKPEQEQNYLSVLRPATLVPESKALDAMLREFKTNRNHMAVVIDEYGNPSGLITIEDVIEEIVGEIDDEHDEIADAQYRQLADGSYHVKALMEIEQFNQCFHTKRPDDTADTSGGYIAQQFGRLPNNGETLELDEQWQISIAKANQRRILLLKLFKKCFNTQSDT